MRRAFLTFAALSVSAALGFAADPANKDRPLLNKKAPEYEINMPNGKNLLLSSFKGKVVCLEFLSTTCPHCQHAAQTYTKLANELGPGMQALGIAINDPSGVLVKDFIRDYKVGYPVGYTQSEKVTHYLEIDPMKRWVVPQVVIIDRKGVVRYQTPWSGDEKVQDENFMRTTLKALLAEPSVAGNVKKAPAKPAPSATKKPDSGTK